MSKLSWSMTDKTTMIKNIAKAEREVLNAKGVNKKKLARYISYMKTALKKKGVKGKINTLQPKLKNLEKAVEVPSFDDVLLQKIIDLVTADKELFLKLSDKVVASESAEFSTDLVKRLEKLGPQEVAKEVAKNKPKSKNKEKTA
jgi:exo-beta-1,3-glucanase (GH17 family)